MRQQLLNFLSHGFNPELFEPNVQKFPDPAKRSMMASKNRQVFMTFFGVTVIYPFTIPFLSFDSDMHIANMIIFSLLTSLYLALCRSYAWVFYIFHTLFISIGPYFMLQENPEIFFFQNGMAIVIPPLIYYISNNIFLTGIAGIAQIINFQTLYKSVLVDQIKVHGLELFATKFAHSFSIICLFVLIFYVLALYYLEKRTIELFNSKKQTEEVLEQHKTFIFSFSHELRNPLNSLLGNLHLALSTSLPPDTLDMITTAKICSEVLLQYINNVLDTGKFEIGKLEVNPVATNVQELFQRVWTISNELIRRKKLKGLIKVEKKVPIQLLMDSQKMNQIFMNLVGNAVKFTERGSVNVRVQWLLQQKVTESCFEPVPYDEIDEQLFEKQQNMYSLESNYCSVPTLGMLNILQGETSPNPIEDHTLKSEGILKITIQDTGCGMPPEALEKLFGKFSQVSNDASKRQIGTGLGLFISKELCRKMEGDVRVYSRYKIGSTFVVCIPMTSVPIERTRAFFSPGMICENLKDRGLKAMVVDDSPFNVVLIINYLKKIGIQVIGTASNGEEGLREYIECRNKGIFIDLVVLEIDMPKMDGKEMCEKVRKFEEEKRLRGTKMVMVSGNYEYNELKEFLNTSGIYKVSHFFKKPVVFEDFSSVIKRVMA